MMHGHMNVKMKDQVSHFQYSNMTQLVTEPKIYEYVKHKICMESNFNFINFDRHKDLVLNFLDVISKSKTFQEIVITPSHAF
jgi:hypothetical protein